MLPKGFNLNHLDAGIKDLVITMNRVPGINPRTTIYGPTSCSGHVYDGANTQDGWFYFYRPTLKRPGLMRAIKQFCGEHPYFELDSRPMDEHDLTMIGFNPIPHRKFIYYNLEAHFDSSKGVWKMSDAEKLVLMEKTKAREQQILAGWNELDSRVKDYIAKKITRDIESLPFMTDEDWKFPRPSCPHHACF